MGFLEFAAQKCVLANIEYNICKRLKDIFQLATIPIQDFSFLNLPHATPQEYQHGFHTDAPTSSNDFIKIGKSQDDASIHKHIEDFPCGQDIMIEGIKHEVSQYPIFQK